MVEQTPLIDSESADSAEWSWAGVGRGLRAGWDYLGRAARNPRFAWVVMALILLLGAALRLHNVDWDEGQHLHPDERFLTMVENSLQWPASISQYFDSAQNPLNPYNHDFSTYVYGLFPIVIAKFLGQVSGYSGYDGVYLAGRVMSALMDLGAVWLIYHIGRRLYDARVGLLAALLLSLTVLDIQQAHFFTVDTTTTLLVTLALYFAVRVAQGEGAGSTVGLGLAFGAAVAAKISVLSFLLIIAAAYGRRLWVRWRAGDGAPAEGADAGARGSGAHEVGGREAGWERRVGRYTLSLRPEPALPEAGPSSSGRLANELGRAFLAMAAVMLLALLAFRVTQPQAFTGPGLFGLKPNEQWLKDMGSIQQLMSGETDYPPSHQWAGRAPVWYALKNQVLWGMGLPLGLAVWAGWGLMAYEMIRRNRWAHLLPWLWMTFTFFYQSVQFVKTMRYLLPIYPTMVLVAAYGLVRLWDWGRARRSAAGPQAAAPRKRRGWRLALGIGGPAAVLLGTAFWALAFSSIYSHPVTRVAASRWIYENIPQGQSLSFELWDDPLPLNVDGRLASAEYPTIQMEPYWEDTPEKREMLYTWIENTQYIILSSNRLYGSIPRLPTRYPMTTRYYEALFSGELGYDTVITFTSRPTFLGIEINDDDADEAFTVYDHPKVTIFVKGEDFDIARVHELFDGYDLDRVVRLSPKQADAAPNLLMLDDEEWAAQREGGTWAALFDRDSLANAQPTLTWLLALYLTGLAAFPLAFAALRGLRDRGYIFARTIGLLLWGYGCWLLASVKAAPFSRGTILAVWLALLAMGGLAAWRQWGALRAFLAERWRLLFSFEALWLLAFALFWLIRRGNPDLWHPVVGGEKPMDLAYLNAIIKSTYFPPYDPWFAGGYINYYYLGWVPLATLIKAAGIVPTTAYNLAVPTLFAMLAAGAASVVYNLVPSHRHERRWLPRPFRYGVLGALFVAVLGNLSQARLLVLGLRALGSTTTLATRIPGLEGLLQVIAGAWAMLTQGLDWPFRPEWWYWNASRVMGNGEINEFPFFTFLYGDLHAHMMAMPYVVLALAVAVSLAVGGWRGLMARDARGRRRPDMGALAVLGLAGLTLGQLWTGNSWDYPVYTGVMLLALLIGTAAAHRRLDRTLLVRLAVAAVAVVGLSLLLYWPYHTRYGMAYSSVELWKGARTTLGAYLLIWGLPLVVLAGYVVALSCRPGTRNAPGRAVRLALRNVGRPARAAHLWRLLVRRPSAWFDLGRMLLVVLAAVWLVVLMSAQWVVLLALSLAAAAAFLACYPEWPPARRLTLSLVAIGALLTVAVEWVVLKGDIGRMNTVFKFYLQVWILWGIAAAVALAELWPRARRAGWWRAGVVTLVLLAALYPLTAAGGKVRDRWEETQPTGLDGTAYMEIARYDDAGRQLTLAHDLRAIEWLQEHVPGSPVIAEAVTPLYRWGSRISVYTGLPTIVGWDWHQKQQRAAVGGQVVDWRLEDVSTLYNTTDVAQAVEILARYGVSLIYVGELEQAYYEPLGLAKFDAMVGYQLDVIYRDGPVTIYRVREGIGGSAAAADGPAVADDAAVADGAAAGEGVIAAVRDWFARHWVGPAVAAEGPDESAADGTAMLPTPLDGAPVIGDVGLNTAAADGTAMLPTPLDEAPVIDGVGWNAAAMASPLLAAICWWLAVQMVGLAVCPAVARLLPQFAGGAYAFSKIIGLLALGYVVWIGASLRLWMNTAATAWAALAVLAAACWWLARRRPVAALWRERRGHVLWAEGLFTGGYLLFVGLRLLNPDLWQPWFGGEKTMEMAILNAVGRSAYMPPYDPYFAGGYLNYYYYGYFLVGLLGKLTGIAPQVAFNLAVPTFFGLTLSASCALGCQLAARSILPAEGTVDEQTARRLAAPSRHRIAAGLTTALAVAVMGNLTTFRQLAGGLYTVGLAASGGAAGPLKALGLGLARVVSGEMALPAFDYWYAPTRAIAGTINEFPFFSFLFADLHPHMMAIPFALLAIALCLGVALDTRGARMPLGAWLLLPLWLGALGPLNTWDLPTYLVLLALVLAFRGYRADGALGVVRGLSYSVILAAAAVAWYAPFYTHLVPQYGGLGLVSAESRSSLAEFLSVWGLFLFALISLAYYRVRQTWRERRGHVAPTPVHRVRLGLMLAALLAAGRLALAGQWTLALLVPLWALVGLFMLSGEHHRRLFIQRAMIWLALSLLIGVELVYLRDWLDGDTWFRMNTVFKYDLQAWVLLAVALGSQVPTLWRHMGESLWGQSLWRSAGIVLAGMALLYPLLAVPARVAERFPGEQPARNTLDGTAYMAVGVYTWPDETNPIALGLEREAIAWLWANVQGTPVMAVAPLGYYREGGTLATAYTGFPALVGLHSSEQRPWEEVALRQSDADALYRTTDPDELRAILARYGVRYVYVGALERYTYSADSLAKFEALADAGELSRAYRNEQVTIYQVLPAQGA